MNGLKFIGLCLFLSIGINVYVQDIDSVIWHEVLKAHEDSVAIVLLDPVDIWGEASLKNKRLIRKYRRKKRKYDKTVRNVKIVYPYAKAANKKIKEINEVLPRIETEKERKKYLNKEYKELMKTYKKPIMSLKISQGKILLLLIDRETGDSSYAHIKELKGSIPAVLWQTMARMFGHNLKAQYDPARKHRMIENIVLKIERGEL